jgi:ribosomal protein L20
MKVVRAPLIRAVIRLSLAGIHPRSPANYACGVSAGPPGTLECGMHTYLKGVAMKRIARTLVVVSLASAATAAVAADTPYPSSAQQETPMSQEFPNSQTYKSEHRNDAGRQSRSLHSQRIASAKAEGVSLNTLIVSLVSQGIGARKSSGEAGPV